MEPLIKLGIPQLIRDLENGLTRYESEDSGWGSIQAKYGMTSKEVEIIFRHPKLKDIQPTRIRFILVEEDFDPTTNVLLPPEKSILPRTLRDSKKGSSSFFEIPEVGTVTLQNSVPDFLNTL